MATLFLPELEPQELPPTTDFGRIVGNDFKINHLSYGRGVLTRADDDSEQYEYNDFASDVCGRHIRGPAILLNGPAAKALAHYGAKNDNRVQ